MFKRKQNQINQQSQQPSTNIFVAQDLAQSPPQKRIKFDSEVQFCEQKSKNMTSDFKDELQIDTMMNNDAKLAFSEQQTDLNCKIVQDSDEQLVSNNDYMMFVNLKKKVPAHLLTLLNSNFGLGKTEADLYLRSHSEVAEQCYQILLQSLQVQKQQNSSINDVIRGNTNQTNNICTFAEFDSTVEQLELGFLQKLQSFNTEKNTVLQKLSQELRKVSQDSILESLNAMTRYELEAFYQKSHRFFDEETSKTKKELEWHFQTRCQCDKWINCESLSTRTLMTLAEELVKFNQSKKIKNRL